MTEALGEPIAHALWTLADHLDGRQWADGPRKAIASAARDVIEAVGEHPGCPACHGDAWMEEDVDKAAPCSECEGTGLDLPTIVRHRFAEQRTELEWWRERAAALSEQAQCDGQQHLGEVAG